MNSSRHSRGAVKYVLPAIGASAISRMETGSDTKKRVCPPAGPVNRLPSKARRQAARQGEDREALRGLTGRVGVDGALWGESVAKGPHNPALNPRDLRPAG